jgi:hypothetical protein
MRPPSRSRWFPRFRNLRTVFMVALDFGLEERGTITRQRELPPP